VDWQTLAIEGTKAATGFVKALAILTAVLVNAFHRGRGSMGRLGLSAQDDLVEVGRFRSSRLSPVTGSWSRTIAIRSSFTSPGMALRVPPLPPLLHRAASRVA